MKLQIFKKGNFSKMYKNKKQIQAQVTPFKNGYFGKLYSLDYGLVEYHDIELIRRFLTKIIQKKGSVIKIVSLTRFVTKKSEHSRMGKGVGKFHKSYSFVQPGSVLFDVRFKDWSTVNRIIKSLHFLHKKTKFKCAFTAQMFLIDLKYKKITQRLTPKAILLGCVSGERQEAFEQKMFRLNKGRALLDDLIISARQLVDAGVPISQDGSKRTGFEALAIEAVTWQALLDVAPDLAIIDEKTRDQLGKDALYANYIERQQKDIEVLRRDEAQVIPPDFAFASIEGLSNELKTKLTASKPANIAQASRIDGMTPSALLLILSRLKSLGSRERAAG